MTDEAELNYYQSRIKNKNCQRESKQQSSIYFQQYQNYFSTVKQQASQYVRQFFNRKQQLANNKIIVLKNYTWNQQLISYNHFISVVGEEFKGLIIHYSVIIGIFKIQLKLLHINRNSEPINEIIGQGAFGSIFKIRHQELIDHKIVSKRIHFIENTYCFTNDDTIELEIVANKKEINICLEQYSLYKICSYFQIGPKIQSIGMFDVICFRDCIEFYVQECKKIIQNTKFYKNHTLQKRLKFCVAVLHQIHIIHKDIKPDNILFSNHYQDFVLNDFGISHSLVEQRGQLSNTFKQGTAGFMSEEMYKLQLNKIGKIDLYYNDMIGLSKSLQLMSRTSKRKKVSEIQTAKNTLNKFYCKIFILSKFLESNLTFQIKKQINNIQFYQSNYNVQLESQCHIISLLIKQYYPSQTIDIQAGQIIEFFNVNCQQSPLEFLRRSYGIHYRLVQFINSISNGQKKYFKINAFIHKKLQLNRFKQIDNILKYQKLGSSKIYLKQIEHVMKFFCQKIQNKKRIQQQQFIVLALDTLFLEKVIQQKNYEEFQYFLNYVKLYQFSQDINGSQIQFYLLLMNLINNRRQLSLIKKIYQFHINQFNITTSIKIKFFSRFTNTLILIQNYQEALKYQMQRLKFIQYIDQSQLCENYQRIGNIYFRLRQYEQALIYYQKSSENIQKYKSNDLYFYYLIQFNLASCYSKLNQLDTSKEIYEKCIKNFIEYITGQNHPIIARIYLNFASLYLDSLDYTKALELYEKSLTILKFFENFTTNTIKCIINICICLRELDKTDEALKYLQQIKDITLVQVQDRIGAFRQFAFLHLKKSDVTKAIIYFQECLKLEKQFNFDSFYTEINYYYCYAILGDFLKALKLLLNLIQNNKNNKKIGELYQRVGNCYAYLDLNDQAIIYYHKSIQANKNLKAQKKLLYQSLTGLGVSYGVKKQYQKSIIYNGNALQICKQIYGNIYNQHQLILMNNIAVNKFKMGKIQESLDLHLQILNIRLKNHDPNHIQNFHTYFNLARCYENLKNIGQAEKYYKIGLKIRLYNQYQDMAYIYYYLINFYFEIKRFWQVIYFAQKLKNHVARNEIPYGILYYSLKNSKKDNIKKAENNKILEIHNQIKNKSQNLLNHYKILINFYYQVKKITRYLVIYQYIFNFFKSKQIIHLKNRILKEYPLQIDVINQISSQCCRYKQSSNLETKFKKIKICKQYLKALRKLKSIIEVKEEKYQQYQKFLISNL